MENKSTRKLFRKIMKFGRTKDIPEFLKNVDAAVLAFLRILAIFFGFNIKSNDEKKEQNARFKRARFETEYTFSARLQRAFHFENSSVAPFARIKLDALTYSSAI